MKRSFLDLVCGYHRLLRSVLGAVIVLLLLTAFSFLFVQPGTASYYIGIFNLLIQVPILVVTVALLAVCGKHRTRKTVDAVADDDGQAGDSGGDD